MLYFNPFLQPVNRNRKRPKSVFRAPPEPDWVRRHDKNKTHPFGRRGASMKGAAFETAFSCGRFFVSNVHVFWISLRARFAAAIFVQPPLPGKPSKKNIFADCNRPFCRNTGYGLIVMASEVWMILKSSMTATLNAISLIAAVSDAEDTLIPSRLLTV